MGDTILTGITLTMVRLCAWSRKRARPLYWLGLGVLWLLKVRSERRDRRKED